MTLSPKRFSLCLRLSACAVAVLLAAVLAACRTLSPSHFRAVSSGVLYRSAFPTAEQLAAVIRYYHIKTVVDLCLPEEDPAAYRSEARVCATAGVSRMALPLAGNTPPTPEQVQAWLKLFQTSQGPPVLVHCRQGVMRTGMMVAIYEMEYGHKANDVVFRDLPWFGHHIDKPQHAPVKKYILEYAPTWQF